MESILVIILEYTGTVAFAVSGSLVAISCGLDIFGVIALGVITSTFGGVFRDLVLGCFPPGAFRDPTYVLAAIVTSVTVFVIMYLLKQSDVDINRSRIFFWMDALGLGIFSVMGVISAYQIYGIDEIYLCVFCGLITGVGGGLLRDICVRRLPAIFVRHIYAIASIFGSAVMCVCLYLGKSDLGMWLGVASVMLLRYLAVRFGWNLPKVSSGNK